MLSNLTGTHAIVILLLFVLFFGAAKLPALARSVGQSVKILKDETNPDSPTEAETTKAIPAVESTTIASEGEPSTERTTIVAEKNVA